jgi:hypothetical protein
MPSIHPAGRRGSSLVETLVAVGLFGLLMPPVLGLLALGLASARKTGDSSVQAFVASQIQHRLRDPSWPTSRSRGTGGAAEGGGWKAQALFDDALRLVHDPRAASLRVEMSAAAGLGWTSDSLEAVRLRIFRQPSGLLVGQCVLQRHRPLDPKP